MSISVLLPTRKRISLIKITKIFSGNGKLIAEAEQKKEVSDKKQLKKTDLKKNKDSEIKQPESKSAENLSKKKKLKEKALSTKKK